MLSLLPSLEKGLVMVQAEVADRLAAAPGSKVYGVPSVKAAWYADVRRAGTIGRNVFWPAPNVDSGLVSWTRREPPVTTASRDEVFAVVDAAFAQRRKVLRARCAAWPARRRPPSPRSSTPGSTPRARGVAHRHRVRPHRGGPRRRRRNRMNKSPHSITVRAPAKINLHLGVGAPREDGMHPLLTVYQAIGLYDDLTVRDAASWRLAVTVADYVAIDSVPQHGHNIVDRAADLLAAHHGIERCGEVLIDKSIPVAGGMAGGSADAAAALVVLDRLWEVNTSDEDLLAIAAELGSDVPFALVGGTALGTGRGELVDPVPDENTWWWVLRLTPVGLSTPEVYRHFDRLFPDAPPTPPPADALLAALAAHDPRGARRLAAQRPAGAGLRPAPRPGEADRVRRGRGRAARPGPAPGPPASTSASRATTPGPSPAPSSRRPATPRPPSYSSPTGRSPARTSSSTPSSRTTADVQPAQPRARLEVLRRPPPADRRLPRHRRGGADRDRRPQR